MKKYFVLWLLLNLGIVLTTSRTLAQEENNPQPPADYRQLPDILVFSDTPYGQWVGSGGNLQIEMGENGRLPIDESEQYNDLPAYRVHVNGTNGWWSFLLAGKDWESYSIAPYFPDGALEFNVKGASGGEDFEILLNDFVVGRNPKNIESEKVALSNVLPVTMEWQHVSIPLSAFLSSGSGFNLDQMFSVVFSGIFNGEEAKEMTFWLNDIKITSQGIEISQPQVKMNQLGYTPNGSKIARISDFREELTADVGTPFMVRNVRNNEIVYEGELTLMSDYDGVVSGERILAADFSELQEPGQYYLSVDAYQVGDSPLFVIDEGVYQNLVVDGLKYFYFQRSGMPLEQVPAWKFARDAGHLQDAQAKFRSGTQPPKDVSGGWYDAGDYGKYVNAGATAVSDLLWAYELFSEQFPDEQLNIPESGNGVPDLLDEVRWELDWILKMQDPASGGFYHMVQGTEDVAVPDALEPRFIEDTDGSRENVRPTATTGSAAAALAHAALVFEPVDAKYAAELLAAAEAGWTYLQENPDGVANLPGPYNDKDDSDNRFWAAAALYRATGSAEFHDYVKRVYRDVETFFESEEDNAYGVSRMEMIGWLTYAHSKGRDAELMAYFEPLFADWSERMVARWQASNWDIALMDEDFYWGSNYVALTTPLVMLVGSDALGEMDETAVLMSQQALDYILGNNPMSYSYVSGYGERSVQHPFSSQWSHDDVVAVPNGVFVGGPNAKTNPHLYSNFAGKRYIDSNVNWTTNEHTIYWNSALVFHAALANRMSDPGAAPIIVPTAEPTPVVESVQEPDPQPETEPELQPTEVAEEIVEESELVVAAETAVVEPAPAPEITAAPQAAYDSSVRTLMIALIITGVVLIVVVIVCTVIILRAVRRMSSV